MESDVSKCRLAWRLVRLALALGSCAAVGRADSLVIVGTGRSGSWDTIIEISNGGVVPITVQLGPVPAYQTACPAVCPLAIRTVGPGQTVQLGPDDLAGYHPAGAGLSFVNGSTLDFARGVTVRARSVNTLMPALSAEVPVVRLSTITSLSPQALIFPGSTRSGSAHSNVLLAEISGMADAPVLVEAFAADGTLLGSEIDTIPSGKTLYLVDVLARLGVSNLADGSIRVTRLGGGTVWGWIGTVFPGAGVHIGLGKNP